MLVVDDGPATPRRAALAARHGARLPRARARRAGSTRRATPASTRRDGRAARASSTTTSRCGPAGSTRCCAPPPRSPRRRRASAARSARASRTTRCRTLRARGPPPVTALDLGPRRPRRRARVGREHGDPPQRARARRAASTRRSSSTATRRSGSAGCARAGGRIRYVAAAGVDHRRAGRRRAPRRALRAPPTAAGAPPPLRRASRAPRRRSPPSCARSPAASAHGPRAAAERARHGRPRAGRLREALRRRRRPPATPADADFLSGRSRARVGGRARRCAARRATSLLDARGAAAPRRAARRPRRAPRRRVLVARRRARRARAPATRPRARARALAPRRRASAPSPAGRARASSRTSTRCSPRIPPARLRLAAGRRRRRRAAARLPRPLPVPSPSASASRSPSPRTALRSHAAWRVTRRRPGVRRAPHARSSRSARSPRFARDDVRRAAAVPGRCAWAGASTSHWARSPRERGWPIGVVDAHAGPPHRARPPAATRATRRSPRRARSSPTAPTCAREPRRSATARGRAPRAGDPMRVAVVAEYYPRARRPGARRLGAPPGARRARRRRRRRVLVLHRPVPPRRALRGPRAARRCARRCASRCARELDGLRSTYVPFVAPPRPRTYGALGRVGGAVARARAAAAAARVPVRPRPRPLRGAGRRRGPARARIGAPLVVSVHGGDVLAPRRGAAPAARAVRARARRRAARARQLRRHRARAPRARRRAHARRAPRHRPADGARRRRRATRPLVTVGHLVARKRHADVLRALWLLRDRHPGAALRRRRRRARARARSSASPASSGVADRVELRGQLPHAEALARTRARRTCSCCRASTRRSASPTSRRWPAACRRSAARGEPGPEEIAARATACVLVPPGDPRRWPRAIDELLADAARARGARRAARARPSSARFTWERCGRATVAAYEDALRVSDARPVLFVTNHAPPYRVGAFAALHEREASCSRCSAARSATAAGGRRRPRRARRRHVEPARASRGSPRRGRYRAVVARHRRPRRAARRLRGRPPRPASRSCCGRALGAPAQRRARASYRPAAHALPPRRRDRHLRPARHRLRRARKARAACREAPQAVDGAFWSAPAGRPAWRRGARSQVVFVGRDEPGKGLDVLLDAWRAAGLRRRGRARRSSAWTATAADGVGPRPPASVRNFYAGSDVVVVPSRPHPQLPRAVGARRQRSHAPGTPVIATDAVGAAAGGLVRNERNGLVVPSERPGALAAALRRLRDDPELRARLGAAAREDVAAYTLEAWAEGIRRGAAAQRDPRCACVCPVRVARDPARPRRLGLGQRARRAARLRRRRGPEQGLHAEGVPRRAQRARDRQLASTPTARASSAAPSSSRPRGATRRVRWRRHDDDPRRRRRPAAAGPRAPAARRLAPTDSTPTPAPAARGTDPLAALNPEERLALDEARTGGGEGIQGSGPAVVPPGSSRAPNLTGSSSLPGPVTGLLILLAGALVIVTGARVRTRVLGRRTA